MKEKQQHQLCALCNRPINIANKTIRGIGKVGPECYRKYSGLESYIAQLQDHCFNYTVALQHISILRHSGIRARLEPSGENTYGSLYRITIVGLRQSTKKYHPKSFAEYRTEFANWLEHNQQKMNIQAAV